MSHDISALASNHVSSPEPDNNGGTQFALSVVKPPGLYTGDGVDNNAHTVPSSALHVVPIESQQQPICRGGYPALQVGMVDAFGFMQQGEAGGGGVGRDLSSVSLSGHGFAQVRGALGALRHLLRSSGRDNAEVLNALGAMEWLMAQFTISR